MLANTFIASYNRAEISLQRSGSLVSHTPGIDSFRITAQAITSEIDLNQDRVPDDRGMINPDITNLIIDNIAIYSTNSELEQFLPLKLQINGNNQIEFGNTQSSSIKDYSVDPLRDEDRQGLLTNRIKVLKTALYKRGIDLALYSNLINADPMINAIHKSYSYYFSFNDPYFQVTDMVLNTVANYLLPENPRLVASNSYQIWCVGTTSIYNLSNPSVIVSRPLNVGSTCLAITPDTNIVYLLVQDGLNLYIETRNHECELLSFNNLGFAPIPFLPSSRYLLTRFGNGAYAVCVSNLVFVILVGIGGGNTVSEYILDIIPNGEKILPQIIDINSTINSTTYYCYGSVNAGNTEISIFTIAIDKLVLAPTISKHRVINSIKPDIVGVGRLPFLNLWRFGLQYEDLFVVLDVREQRLNFINLINEVTTKVDIINFTEQIFNEIQSFDLTDDYLSMITQHRITPNRDATFVYAPNQRVANVIYKHDFNYIERTYVVETNTKNFNLLILSDFPVQLEIFKVVIDYRLRYSKQPRDTNVSRTLSDNRSQIEANKRQILRDKFRDLFSEFAPHVKLSDIMPVGEESGLTIADADRVGP